jgi:hypothetical protein
LGGEWRPTWGKCRVRVINTKSHDVLQDRIILCYIFKLIIFVTRLICILFESVFYAFCFVLRSEEAMGKAGEKKCKGGPNAELCAY